MSSEAIAPIDRSKLEGAKAKWKAELDQLRDLPCESAEQREWWANSIVAVAQSAIKELEDDRVLITKPINADLRRINAEFTAAKEPAEAVKVLALGKIRGYLEASSKAEEALLEQAATLAAAGETEACQAALAALPEVEEASTATRTEWVWELDTDAQVDFTKVPVEMLTLDLRAVAEYCKQHKGSKMIPPVDGLVFKRVARVAPTGRK